MWGRWIRVLCMHLFWVRGVFLFMFQKSNWHVAGRVGVVNYSPQARSGMHKVWIWLLAACGSRGHRGDTSRILLPAICPAHSFAVLHLLSLQPQVANLPNFVYPRCRIWLLAWLLVLGIWQLVVITDQKRWLLWRRGRGWCGSESRDSWGNPWGSTAVAIMLQAASSCLKKL